MSAADLPRCPSQNPATLSVPIMLTGSQGEVTAISIADGERSAVYIPISEVVARRRELLADVESQVKAKLPQTMERGWQLASRLMEEKLKDMVQDAELAGQLSSLMSSLFTTLGRAVAENVELKIVEVQGK